MLRTVLATFQTVMGRSSLSYQSACGIITEWNFKPPRELIFDSSPRDIRAYLEAVDIVHQSSKSNGNNDLLNTAMARLEREFQTVLRKEAGSAVGPSSVTELSSVIDSTANAINYEDYYNAYKDPKTPVINYLTNVAKIMSSCGNLEDCIRAYQKVRKTFLQSQLEQLGFEEPSLGETENIRRYIWDKLKVKIERWNQASEICVKIFIEKEKKLCEEIFQDLGAKAAKDKCFVGTVTDFALRFFGFAKAVSLSNQPYERMEVILGLYNAFLSISDISNSPFPSESGKSIQNFCSKISSNIERDVQRMLYDFENEVLRESSNDSDENGSIQRSTRYVMEQINVIVRNKSWLANLIKSTPSLDFGHSTILKEELGDFDSKTCLELHLILIIVVLRKNFEDKSKRYTNPILGHLFMMNNINFTIQKIEGYDDLPKMIGDHCLNKLNQNLELAKNSYQTSTCNKFLTCFEEDGLHVTRCFCSTLSKTGLKGRMKAFNNVFEEIKVSQTLWAVPDLELRKEIHLFMSNTLVPAYTKFLKKFSSNDKISIAHSAKDLEDLITQKFSSATNQDTV